jgi:hypothetical protein
MLFKILHANRSIYLGTFFEYLYAQYYRTEGVRETPLDSLPLKELRKTGIILLGTIVAVE